MSPDVTANAENNDCEVLELGARKKVFFFDYPDVFEDFYSAYGVTQRTFVERWVGTGNHAFVSLIQKQIADVIWCAFSVSPEVGGSRHRETGCDMRMFRSSLLHRALWTLFYGQGYSWRLHRFYRAYEFLASYLSLFSYEFLREFWRIRPDLLFLQDYATGRFDVLLILAKLSNRPLIAYHSGSAPENYVGRFFKRWALPRADCLIASSAVEKTMLVERFNVAPAHVRVVLTPIDTAQYCPMDRRLACEQLGLESSRRYFLFVGRLEDRIKRVTDLLRAFEEIADQFPHIDLLVLGDGPDRKKLSHMAEEIGGGRIRLIGWIADIVAKRAYYSAADCLILPSLTEGFPTVVGEAMACGTPVLASNVGGVGELVRDGETGWTIRPGDIGDLREKMREICRNDSQLLDMRPAARRCVEERCSPAVVSRALSEIFEASIQSHA